MHWCPFPIGWLIKGFVDPKWLTNSLQPTSTNGLIHPFPARLRPGAQHLSPLAPAKAMPFPCAASAHRDGYAEPEDWGRRSQDVDLGCIYIIYSTYYIIISLSISRSRSISISVSISIYLPTYLSIYLSLSIYLYLSIYLSIYLYLSIFLYLSLSIYLSIYPSIYLSIHLSIYLSIYLSIFLSLQI